MNAIGLKITNFHYPDQVFVPPGEFVEFPKWVHRPGYPSVIVQDAQEEAELLQNTPFKAPPGVEPIEHIIPATPVPDERVALLQLAKERGIKADGRWKTDRLKAALEAAG